MAGIVERLVEGTNNIPFDYFIAAMNEYLRGTQTKDAIVSGFSLNANEAAEVDLLLTRITTGDPNARLTTEQIHDICSLAEAGFTDYNTAAKCRALMGL